MNLDRRHDVAPLVLRPFPGAVLVWGTQDNVFSHERMLEFRDVLAQKELRSTSDSRLRPLIAQHRRNIPPRPGRPPAGRPGRPRGGGASAAAPC
jgi:hypothetical protein